MCHQDGSLLFSPYFGGCNFSASGGCCMCSHWIFQPQAMTWLFSWWSRDLPEVGVYSNWLGSQVTRLSTGSLHLVIKCLIFTQLSSFSNWVEPPLSSPPPSSNNVQLETRVVWQFLKQWLFFQRTPVFCFLSLATSRTTAGLCCMARRWGICCGYKQLRLHVSNIGHAE